MMVSDIVLLAELPDFVKESIEAYAGCVAGALLKDDYIRAMEDAGFRGVSVVGETHFPVELMANDPTVKAFIENSDIPMEELRKVADSVVSIKIHATKPAGFGCCS
jgi:hypothetical protein